MFEAEETDFERGEIDTLCILVSVLEQTIKEHENKTPGDSYTAEDEFSVEVADIEGRDEFDLIKWQD